MDWRAAPVTVGLTVATLVASALLVALGLVPWAAVAGGFIPVRLAGSVVAGDVAPAWLTPLTATLVHGGVAHLAFNLVMLAFCGAATERALGGWGIAILYGVGAYAAALGQWLIDPASIVPMIGASGAISAIVAAYALLYGERRAKAIGPIPAEAAHVAWLATGWIGIQLLLGIAGSGAGMTGPIAIGAHIGGFVAGLALARPLLRWRYRHA